MIFENGSEMPVGRADWLREVLRGETFVITQ